MTDDPGAAAQPATADRREDAAHLDEDPEALEDPVHRGDALHQHEVHSRSAEQAD